MWMQSVIRAIYPSHCVACDSPSEGDFGLCGPCWRETHFIGATICDKCGTQLPGDHVANDLICDDCMTIARPWDKGRAVLAYTGVGRKLVLSLKHGDRTDLAHPVSQWMARLTAPLLKGDTILVPVPLHRFRLIKRRYNQAALLANALSGVLGREACVDALLRTRNTAPLKGHSRDARFAALSEAIRANPDRAGVIRGKHILLVDDVMTSGATLAACTEACMSVGARSVDILTLARTVKDT